MKSKTKETDFWKGIETKIKPIVRLLRDNGFNTTCSCHHDMEIELDLGNHMDEVERLANLLADNGYKGFKIVCELRMPGNAFWDRRATLYLKGWM